MKNLICVIVTILFFTACGKTIVRKSYPEKFEGQTQLVLASETTNISFIDTVQKKLLFFKISDAQIRVQTNVTFDFYVDFEKDGYQVTIDSTNDALHFLAPPIRVKKPQYNTREISYPDKGIFVNEDKEALRILNRYADRMIENEGIALLNEEYVQKECHDKLHEFLTKLCSDLKYDIKSITVEFYKDIETGDTDIPVTTAK